LRPAVFYCTVDLCLSLVGVMGGCDSPPIIAAFIPD
jgi:hypothetical protein